MSDDPLRELWTNTEEEEMTVDVMRIRREHADLHRTVSRRNLIEVFAAGLVVALFGARAWGADTLAEALGPALVALGAVVIAGWLMTRGQPLPAEPAASTRSFVAQRRAELEHQAALLERVPLWYIGPLVPGLVVIMAVAWPGLGDVWALANWGVGVVIHLVVGGGIAWLNARAARRLRDEAAALPELGE